MIEFVIDKEPCAQKRHRHVNRGKFVTIYDPSSKDKKDFRRLCIENQPLEPWTDAISIEVTFAFTRPKSHYGAGKNANMLKPSAPEFHTKKPDIDNLQKFLMDALNGVYWHDDSIIDEIIAHKIWAEDKGYTKVVIVEPNDNIDF